MGDGRVALILDVIGLAQRARASAGRDATKGKIARMTSEASHRGATSADVADREEWARSAKWQFRFRWWRAWKGSRPTLAKSASETGRSWNTEGRSSPWCGSRKFCLQGVKKHQIVQGRSDGSIEVVIYSEYGHIVGLIVDCIVDIVDEQAAIDALASRPGVVGSFATEDSITELLDLPTMVRAAVPGFLEDGHASAAGA